MYQSSRTIFNGVNSLSALKPAVTVIVPAYNAAGALRICLNALLRQDYPSEKFRVIVVNDGSTDTTAEIFREMNLPENFRLVEHPENRGLAATRNTGIRNTTGEIIIFLDSDMEVGRDFIARHVAWYDQPEVMGIVSELLPAPENPYDKYQRYLYESRRGARTIGIDRPLPFQYFIFGLTSIRHSALKIIDAFDADICQYGGEDTEMAYRLWQKFPNGMFFDPEIKVIHHHYRPFDHVLKIVEKFGRQVVPYLVEKHPELGRIYGMQFIKSPGESNRQIKYWVGRTLQTDFIFKTLWFFFEITPFPLSNWLVRGLLASALIKGIAGG